MNRFFTKLRTDKPVTRNNYFMQIVRRDDDPERLNSIDGDEMGKYAHVQLQSCPILTLSSLV